MGAKSTKPAKIALPPIIAHDLGQAGEQASLFVDSILSQAETEEVEHMLALESEATGGMFNFSGRQIGFFTSTQMKRDERQMRASPLLMSPIMDPRFQNPSCRNEARVFSDNNRFSILEDDVEVINRENNSREEANKVGYGGYGGQNNNLEHGAIVNNVTNKDVTNSSTANEEAGDHENVRGDVRGDGTGPQPNALKAESSDGGEGRSDDKQVDEPLGAAEARIIISALKTRSDKLEDKVEELRASLEFSQKEIDDLKAANHKLQQQIGDLETEEERLKYQMKKLDDRIDKVETSGKKKNLIIEGMPEIAGGKEDVVKTIWELLDQMPPPPPLHTLDQI